MKTLVILLIGAALGIGAYIFLSGAGHRSPISRAGDRISNGAGELKDKWNENIELDASKIKDELAHTGKVIRKKAEQAGNAISDATADARITTAIKGKLALESDIASLKISVNTTGGVVTLSGTVPSHESILKVMKLALAVDGVSQVVSTLQVKP